LGKLVPACWEPEKGTQVISEVSGPKAGDDNDVMMVVMVMVVTMMM
jgi:hypothetical protein